MSQHSADSPLLNLTSFCIISAMALLFGYWFASMQVNAVYPDSLSTYPSQYFVMTVIKCYLTIAAFYVLSQLVLSHLASRKLSSELVAATFAPIVLLYVHCPILWVVCAVLALQLICLAKVLQREDYQRLRSSYAGDVLVFVLFFMLHFFMTTRFSPLHWNKAILVALGYNSEEIPVLATVFNSFVLAKQFSFTNIDHAQWAGIMHPPVTLISPLLQIITFIFDLPSVSYNAFHVMISALYFILMVAGSFGFYLFLKYGAKVHSFFAVFGGYLFMFSGAPLLNQMFISDGGIFLSSLIVFPYALLAISCAYEKNNSRYAAWAGLAMASQFFLFAPHPEGTLYSLFFFYVYTLGLFLFTINLPWKRKFYLGAVSAGIFFCLSAFTLVPLMTDKLLGHMYVYAHTGDINHTYFEYFQPYVRLFMVFAPLSLILLALYKKITPTYLSSLLLAFCLLGCVYIIIDAEHVAKVVHFFHLGLHIWVPSRIGVYVYTGMFIISIYGLDMIARTIFDLLKTRYIHAAGE